MKPKTVKIFIAVIIAYLILLTWMVSYLFYCNLDFNPNNAAAVIVAILGILITAILGWQVFNAIEVSRQVHKMQALDEEIQQSLKEAEQKNDEAKALTEGLFLYNFINQDRSLGLDSRYIIHSHIVYLLLKANVPFDYSILVETIATCKGSFKAFEDMMEGKKDFIPFYGCYEVLYSMNGKIAQLAEGKSNEFNNIKEDLEYIRKKCDELCKGHLKRDSGKNILLQILKNPFKWVSSHINEQNNNPNPPSA